MDDIFLPWGLAPAILKGSDFRRSSSKCPVNLVSKNGLKCCCCPAKYKYLIVSENVTHIHTSRSMYYDILNIAT